MSAGGIVHQLGDEDRASLNRSALATPTTPLQVRPFEAADWLGVWALLAPVFRAGETFPHNPGIREAEAQAAWVEQSLAVMVAVDPAGAVVGTNYLRPHSLRACCA